MPIGGTIEISAQNIILKEREHALLQKGKYVKISIKDFGIGIPAEMLIHIFDPFFTTKSKGHGLGLATCFSIINRHRGCINAESELGKSSTFHIYLPATTDNISSFTKPSIRKHHGSGTFVVMDDEMVMRDIICTILERVGYTVVCKENGQDALNFFIKEINAKRDIAGMIFDLTVPGGMGGKETIAEIRKLNSKLPVFVASGYGKDPIMANPSEYGFTASICKPFKKDELLNMLNKYIKESE